MLIQKEFLCSVFVLLSITMIFSGCVQSASESNKILKENSDKHIKIGLSLATLQEERWQRDRDIFVAKAKELGAEVIVQTANNNDDEQLKQIKFLLNENVDIIVIVPHDADKCSEAVRLAKKDGKKVLSYDRLIRNSNVDMYISFDNVGVGEMMAKYLTQTVPEGNYLIINGAKTDNNSFMFNEGYKNILSNGLNVGNIKIIDEIWAEDWRSEDARNCVEQALMKKEKIDAIIAANDSLAGAAIEALAEYRLAGKVEVVGHDADLSACQRVVEGTQLMTVYKPIEMLAQKAAEVAISMAKGESVDANSNIYDGKYTVPYIMIQPIAITKLNMKDTIIRSGFHNMEDVFRNVPKSEWMIK